MRNSIKLFFKSAVIGLFVSMLFITVGYFYLENKFKPVENGNISSVPYYSVPQNAGVMFNICGEKTLFYLDFEEKVLSVVLADGTETESSDIYGYSVDYTVEGDYSLVGGIVDKLYGIDLETDGSVLSLTGVQVEELLSTTADSGVLQKNIAQKIILKISENGFEKEDFLYIIENSETDLTVPVCYYWCEHMKDVCKNARFIGFSENGG